MKILVFYRHLSTQPDVKGSSRRHAVPAASGILYAGQAYSFSTCVSSLKTHRAPQLVSLGYLGIPWRTDTISVHVNQHTPIAHQLQPCVRQSVSDTVSQTVSLERASGLKTSRLCNTRTLASCSCTQHRQPDSSLLDTIPALGRVADVPPEICDVFFLFFEQPHRPGERAKIIMLQQLVIAQRPVTLFDYDSSSLVGVRRRRPQSEEVPLGPAALQHRQKQ